MERSEKYWQKMADNITDAPEARNKRIDTSQEEADFFRNYLSISDEILDIGSGTGLVINKLYSDVKDIIALERFEGLSRFIENQPNIMVINARMEGFLIRKEFDKILCTGVMQFFTLSEAELIYQNIFKMLKTEGLFLMRTHCGLKETVTVNKSDENGGEYFAEYRLLENEVNLLKKIGFSNVQVLDKAPSALNVWENTRHFVFICKK